MSLGNPSQIDWSDARAVADAFFPFGAGELTPVAACGEALAAGEAEDDADGMAAARNEVLEHVEAAVPGAVLELDEAVSDVPARGEAGGEALVLGEAADDAGAAVNWGVVTASNVVCVAQASCAWAASSGAARTAAS